MEYNINKGIGKGPEFKGLKGRWMFTMAGGMVTVLLLGLAIQFIGGNPYIGVTVSLLMATLLVHYVFQYNKKYGEHGLTKLAAQKSRPKYIVIRRPRVFYSLNQKKAEKKTW